MKSMQNNSTNVGIYQLLVPRIYMLQIYIIYKFLSILTSLCHFCCKCLIYNVFVGDIMW